MRDADEAIAYLISEHAHEAALGFVDELERAYRQISRHPASGSLRYAFELGIPGLRHVTLKRYSYLVFYQDRADHLDVWRVLHATRDIPAWLRLDVDTEEG